MPNWCDTHYCFYGDKKDMDRLEQTLKAATSKTYAQSDFGDNWLGNMLHAVGLGSKTSNIPCRGEINLYDRRTENGLDCIHVHTSEAWTYMPEMWKAVLEALKLKSVKLSFYAEETNDDCYVIYDPHGLGFFTDTYHISYDIDGDDHYFQGDDDDTIDELTDIITQITGKTPETADLDKLIEEAYELDDNNNYILIVPIKRIVEPIYDPKIA